MQDMENDNIKRMIYREINGEYLVSPKDILFDIAAVIQDCFSGIVEQDNNKLRITFDNGQKFLLYVEESYC